MDTQAIASTQAHTSQPPKILIVSSIDISLLRFRGRFIERLVQAGFQVLVAAPEFSEPTRLALESIGADTREFPLNRAGMNPVKDWASQRALRQIMVKDKIGLVFSYNIKPVLYASLAAANLGIPAISLITGLGYGFSGDTLKARVVEKLLTSFYRKALKKNAAVIFQNTDDKDLFESFSLLPSSAHVTVVDGSGVDLDEFQWREPSGSANLRFFICWQAYQGKRGGAFHRGRSSA